MQIVQITKNIFQSNRHRRCSAIWPEASQGLRDLDFWHKARKVLSLSKISWFCAQIHNVAAAKRGESWLRDAVRSCSKWEGRVGRAMRLSHLTFRNRLYLLTPSRNLTNTVDDPLFSNAVHGVSLFVERILMFGSFRKHPIDQTHMLLSERSHLCTQNAPSGFTSRHSPMWMAGRGGAENTEKKNDRWPIVNRKLQILTRRYTWHPAAIETTSLTRSALFI